MRRGYTFVELGWWYGIGASTAQDYFVLMRDAFETKISPLLFFLQEASAVKENVPQEFSQRFPHILLLGDGTNFRINKPQNFAWQTISYSTYKKCNSFQIVICELKTPLLCNTPPNICHPSPLP